MAFNVNSNGCNINRKAVCLWTMLMLDETASIKTLFYIEDIPKNISLSEYDYLLELNVCLYHMLPLLIVLCL